ncbi:MAG: flippase [Eubacteriales bacterium]
MKTNKYINNASWIISGQVLQMIISLFVGMVSARYLGPTNYGTITYTAAFVAFVSSIANLGVDGIIINEFVADKKHEGQLLGTAIVMKLVSSCVCSLGVCTIIYVLKDGDKEVVTIAFLQSMGMVAQSFAIIKCWFQVKLQSKTTTMVALVAYILVVLYKIVILILQKNIVWFGFTSCLENTLIALFLYYNYKKYGTQNFSVSWTAGKRLLGKGYHFILSGLMVAVYGYMDKIMIGEFMDDTAVGYYGAAMYICQLWPFILTAIIDTFKPAIYEHKQTENKVLYEKRMTQLYAAVIWISIAVSVGITLFAKWIILILYGQEYLPAVAALRIITWYTAFAYIGVAKTIWLVAEDKQKYEKRLCVMGAIANVILNIIFIPTYGIIGAAVATLVTQIITNFIMPLLIPEIRTIGKQTIDAFLLRNVITKEQAKELAGQGVVLIKSKLRK